MMTVLASRLPLDIVWLVREHGASTIIQAAARGRLARRGPLPSSALRGFAPCNEGEYAYEGLALVGEALGEWCGVLRPGAYRVEVSLSFADGALLETAGALTVGVAGSCAWRTPLVRDLVRLQRAFEPHYGPTLGRVRVAHAVGGCAW